MTIAAGNVFVNARGIIYIYDHSHIITIGDGFSMETVRHYRNVTSDIERIAAFVSLPLIGRFSVS